jgi:hypothetical protein
MLRFRRPPRSLLFFLAVVVVLGVAFGQTVNAVGIAAFFLFIAAIDPKPSWKFQFGKPGTDDDGRVYGRFNSWQRLSATSPKEIARLPKLRDF